MAIQRIFYLTSTSMSVFYCRKGSIELLGEFEVTDYGRTKFGNYIAQQPDIPSAMVVDVVEEEFHTDHIPHVAGLDRKRLLSRKKTALFRQTRFSTAQILKRESGIRKGYLVLFSGLTRPETLEAYLEQLRFNKVPLSGIYSMAALAKLLVKKLGLKHPNAELLSIQQGSLLRQSFFNNVALKSSRLTFIKGDDEASCQRCVLNEVDKNQNYLRRLQLLQAGEPVVVYILSGGRQQEYLRSACIDSDLINFHHLNLNDVARKIGLVQQFDIDQAERCFCYLLSRWLPAGNYATGTERNYYRQYWLRSSLKVASVLMLLVSCGWSISLILDGLQLSQETARLAKHTHVLEQEYHRQAARLPALNYPPKAMREAVELNRALRANKPRSLDALMIFGNVLLKHKNVEIDELNWGVEVVVDDYGKAKSIEVATIKAHLHKFPHDFQRAFQQIDEFMKDLTRSSSVQEVDPLSLPLNTNPESTLRGESQQVGDGPIARFELKIKLKARNEAQADLDDDRQVSLGNG